MAVGLKKRRKAPISFHFTAGTNAETLSVLIKRSINAQQLRLQLWQRNSLYDGSSSHDESTKLRNPWGAKSSKDPMARLNGVMWKGSCNHLAVSMLIGRMWIKDNLYTYSCIIISLMHMCQ